MPETDKFRAILRLQVVFFAVKAQDVSRTIQYCTLKSGKKEVRVQGKKPIRVVWIRMRIQDGEWPALQGAES